MADMAAPLVHAEFHALQDEQNEAPRRSRWPLFLLGASACAVLVLTAMTGNGEQHVDLDSKFENAPVSILENEEAMNDKNPEEQDMGPQEPEKSFDDDGDFEKFPEEAYSPMLVNSTLAKLSDFPTSVDEANALMAAEPELAKDLLQKATASRLGALFTDFLLAIGTTVKGEEANHYETSEEHDYRFKLFKKSLVDIIDLNMESKSRDANDLQRTRYGITQLADWSAEDFSNINNGSLTPSFGEPIDMASVAKSVDTASGIDMVGTCKFGTLKWTGSRVAGGAVVKWSQGKAWWWKNNAQNWISLTPFSKADFDKLPQATAFTVQDKTGKPGLAAKTGVRCGWQVTNKRPTTSYIYLGLGEARSQGTCGSCFLHAAEAVLRTGIKRKTGKDPGVLSVQYAIDCDPDSRGKHCPLNKGVVEPGAPTSSSIKMKQNGCCGGLANQALDWFARSGGVPGQADYGYGKDYSDRNPTANYRCLIPKRKLVTCDGSYMLIDEYLMALHLMNTGSLAVGIYATDGPMKHYVGGPINTCGPGHDGGYTASHAIELVGIDSTYPGGPVWILRNSWGPNWGVNPQKPYAKTGPGRGYFLIRYGKNVCNILTNPYGAKNVRYVR